MNVDKEIEELATEIYTLFRSRPMSRALARHLYYNGWRNVDSVTFVGGVVEQLKGEVARQIFEEIDNILYKFTYPSLTAIGKINVINAEGYHLHTRDYAELKKKYTENKE